LVQHWIWLVMPKSLWTANCGAAPAIVMFVITGAAARAATVAPSAKAHKPMLTVCRLVLRLLLLSSCLDSTALFYTRSGWKNKQILPDTAAGGVGQTSW
jgi:hypothetical protein